MAEATSRSEQETFEFAKHLAESLSPPAHVLLYGDLGTGKTIFAKGLSAGFGVEDVDEVCSPTFTLINQYQGRIRLYHIDLYRLETGAVEDLGLEEIFDDPKAAAIVEWADRLGRFEVPGAVRIFLTTIDDQTRQIVIEDTDAKAQR